MSPSACVDGVGWPPLQAGAPLPLPHLISPVPLRLSCPSHPSGLQTLWGLALKGGTDAWFRAPPSPDSESQGP